MYIIQITPDIYQITDRRANMFLCLGDTLTLIDTGFRSSVPLLVDNIRQLGRAPEDLQWVILTHNHLDHIGGTEELRKITHCRIAAQKTDFEIKQNSVPYPGGGYMGKILTSPIFRPLRQRFLLESGSIDVPLSDNQVLPVNGGLQVVTTPGHTRGSISIYLREQKILFVGDALNKRVGMPLRTVSNDYPSAAASIRKMAALDVKILCFGHGKPIVSGAQIYLDNLVDKLEEKHIQRRG